MAFGGRSELAAVKKSCVKGFKALFEIPLRNLSALRLSVAMSISSSLTSYGLSCAMAKPLAIVFLFLLFVGCGSKENRVIDTSSRPKSTISPEEMDKMMQGEPMVAPKPE